MYKYFWKSFSPFSNWYKAFFHFEGETFSCMEQYMMWKKALLFKDEDVANEIMQTNNPKEIKELGRKVKNFNDKKWNEVKYEIVKSGIREKFKQNPQIKRNLLNYVGYTFVEASPFDRIWGIGYDEENAPKNIPKWGENLLGKALTEICAELYSVEKNKK